jgi:hypothetical protein
MKTQTSFVRTERAVHLDAKPAIDLNLAFVIDPRNAELNHPLGLDKTFQDLSVSILLVTLDGWPDRFEDFCNGLKELRLIWIALFNNFENLLHQAHKGVISAGYLPPEQTKRMVCDAAAPASLREALRAGVRDSPSKRRFRYARPNPILSCFSRSRAFSWERHAS